MFLPEAELQPCIDRVKAAFPRFGDWQYVNEKHRDYSGFTLWGKLVFENNFFITFDIYDNTWASYLSVGKHSYFWSSADFGDAHLLGTGRFASLEEAITDMKGRIEDFFAALSASIPETGMG